MKAAVQPAGGAPRALAWPVSIGEAARRAGVSARMVRHYESLGLVAGVARTDSGYRQYTAADVHGLRFIRRARDLGFSMEEIAGLLALWQDRSRASSQVKRIAQAHIEDLNERIAAMQAMQRSLQTLVSCCHGDERPDCPILDDLAGEPAPPRH
ncbi:Cu(I)-responsive transcriptional regulator [Acidovorax sp. Root219]|uniref:Cu(I)-responsive transcriptional regulator n=1 Tax=Acidovorax sp. Root219 TaxID=1736493 RepID=UPI00070F573D|nr:Cu(I)-responsive transcriptional regulator [Acidovorax sp. Root219]KRC28971.1 MerR family transcriptional regulator [Acidovorax sp. Root219]